MKTVGVLAVSASPSGFAMAAIAQGKAPDESALRDEPVDFDAAPEPAEDEEEYIEIADRCLG